MPFNIVRNDLSTVTADAIVVPANEQLQITGGVGLAVAQVAGLKKLQRACNRIGFCPCGSAVKTPAYGLPAKMVIHAVGPVWQGGALGEADFLRSAYDSALECAADAGARSIALPLISAGTYGFPADVSLAVARESIRAFLNRHDSIDVMLVLFSRKSVTAGMAAYLEITEYIDDHYVEEIQQSYGYADRSYPMREQPQMQPLPMSRPRTFGRLVSGGKRTKDAAPVAEESLEHLLDTLDEPFSTTLLALIDKRGMTDAQVYKRANMSRQLFSKIRSDSNYRPTKKTVLALAVALGLTLEETRDLLARAGFALSSSNKADVIVEYFITRGNYDIFEINEALYAFDQPLL